MKIDVPRTLYALGIRDASLRRNEWWAKCPFPNHLDKEPSWSIRDQVELQTHGYHKCFGCKQSGGPISLVQEVLGITAHSANRWLLENGLVLGEALRSIPEITVEVGSEARRVNNPPLTAFLPLEQWPILAREYAENRGITPQHVLRYKLGYSIHGRLAGRIVLPAYDTTGQVTSYTARSFLGDPRRYLNARTSEGYPIKSALFGEHTWAECSDEIVFTSEGAINALVVDEALNGEFAVAAFLGSQITPVQVNKLARFSKIVHMVDADLAGREFALLIENAMGTSCEVHRVKMAGDPSELGHNVVRKELENGPWW